MRKAEEYLEEYDFKCYKGVCHKEFFSVMEVLEMTRQIQLEAIEETVKFCAENIRLEKAYDYGTFNEEYAKFKEYAEDVFVEDTRGFGECGYVAIRPSKQSILNCAEILKKDL